MRRIARAAYRRAPWKNGYGTTLDIAIAPGSEPAWRVSLATIERSGPFSDFTGYDRTIVVVSGSGCVLRLGNGEAATLEALRPYAFRGEEAVSADMQDGPVEALNVMSKRIECGHRVGVHHPGTPLLRSHGTLVSLLYLLDSDEAGDTVIDPSGSADLARFGIDIVVDRLAEALP